MTHPSNDPTLGIVVNILHDILRRGDLAPMTRAALEWAMTELIKSGEKRES